VERLDDAHFNIFVKEAPNDGRANKAAVKALADFLGIAKTHFRITLGRTYKEKVLEIE
jgi:uncharacterized protein YggU (UPF0235/DUF167 family)